MKPKGRLLTPEDIRLIEKEATRRLLRCKKTKRPKKRKRSILYGKPVRPSNSTCPQCKKHKVMGRKRMTAILSGGAMRVTDAKNKCAEMAEDCIGFLELRSHGDIDAHVSLADDTPSGQFEFYFCSTRCLRAFLNGCIDALELKIEEKRSKR